LKVIRVEGLNSKLNKPCQKLDNILANMLPKHNGQSEKQTGCLK